ncbi:hypothetical protein B0H14DRAFT_2579636 [Mycena olivaceomarginata]|nr:hypothetical protein B0H14DRAFT_2579636 [Mycena olivaceomarginata]
MTRSSCLDVLRSLERPFLKEISWSQGLNRSGTGKQEPLAATSLIGESKLLAAITILGLLVTSVITAAAFAPPSDVSKVVATGAVFVGSGLILDVYFLARFAHLVHFKVAKTNRFVNPQWLICG